MYSLEVQSDMFIASLPTSFCTYFLFLGVQYLNSMWSVNHFVSHKYSWIVYRIIHKRQ